MSPARSKRTPLPQHRDRSEIVKAVAAAVGIALVTAIVVWLLRPGPAGTVGTGGLSNRQPRSSGLIFADLLVLGVVTWWVLRVSKRSRGHEKIVLPIALGIVVLLGVVGGILWPGGLLRHDVAPPKPVTPETTPTTISTSTSTGATGASGASGGSGATGATGASGATGATTTTPATTPTTTTPAAGTATTTSP